MVLYTSVSVSSCSLMASCLMVESLWRFSDSPAENQDVDPGLLGLFMVYHCGSMSGMSLLLSLTVLCINTWDCVLTQFPWHVIIK